MKRKIWVAVFVVALTVGAMVAIVLNRQWMYDFWRGMNYEITDEMATIRDELRLTGRGEFLFNAAWPKLSEREEFNEYCRAEVDVEMAVLGCYTGGNIYVYNIMDKELAGIRELTTAHELLHVVWERMSEAERADLEADLERVYKDNQEVLANELDNYAEAERLEELYVRAGTEVKKLPSDLEKHYGEVFTDQDKVVEFYEQYIGVFREIEAEMESLKAEMAAILEVIESGTVGYEEMNRLVDEYNELVERYNADVVRGEELNQMVRSQ